jgi:hypothetical protein
MKMRDHSLLRFPKLNTVIKTVVLLADFGASSPLSSDYEKFYLQE